MSNKILRDEWVVIFESPKKNSQHITVRIENADKDDSEMAGLIEKLLTIFKRRKV